MFKGVQPHSLMISYKIYTKQYYTIIDFNEVDIRIYLPEKVIIHGGRQAEVNITVKGR